MAIHRLKQQGSVAPAQPQPCKAPVNTASLQVAQHDHGDLQQHQQHQG